MSDDWPEPVERVARFLLDERAEARIEEFEAGTPTAADAARAVGCERALIVKSLVFECDGKAVLAMVRGDRRADPAKVAAASAAESARVASPARVRELTGFEPGAVAPFPLPGVERALLDRGLLPFERIWIGAGSPKHMAVLPPAELLRLSRAIPVDIAADD
jgi:prolyl-tRNA editing enzyme YbaK/EbsC (Cys-tRNA(Pro) deacylase)